jgi:hypothetical protein
MTADYDSEADALSIDLVRFDRYDRQVQVDDDNCCSVGFVAGKVVDLELLYPARHLDLLNIAAERYDLDGEALIAIARAALEAPNRLITMDVSGSLVA